MSVLGGALSYRKKTNDFYVNETGTNDGWVPLPISVGAENLTKEDLESWAKKLGGQNQNQIFVDRSNPLASDSRDNRGNASLRPYRTLERALLEVARTSIKIGPTNDLYERTSINLAPGEYEIYNGPSGLLGEFENYGRYQDAANLIGRNRIWIIESVYATIDPQYQSDKCKTDLTYYLNALINDLTIRGNYYTVKAARVLVSPDPNLVTESPPSAGYFIAAYADEDKRIETIAALEQLRLRAIDAMRNLGAITDPSITVDDESPVCADVASSISSIINITKDTLGCVIDPRNPGLVSYGSVNRGSFPYGEPTRVQLQAFNSMVQPGVILPRGVSIVGEDLRKVVIRPNYVPDPADPTAPRGSIFRMTGGNFFQGFTIKDGQGKEYSHHKLNAFEFCSDADLNIYYDQVRLSFSDPAIYHRAVDAANLLEQNATWIQSKGIPNVVPAGYLNYAKIFEAEAINFIVALQQDLRGLTNQHSKDFGVRFYNAHILPLPTEQDKDFAQVYYEELFDLLMPFIILAITNEAFTEEGGYQDHRIIADPGSTYELNTITYSGRCANIQAALFTLKDIILNRIKNSGNDGEFSRDFSDGDAESRYEEASIVLGLDPTNPPDLRDVDPDDINTVLGASPYIFSASIRSEWGLCGINGDGALVSGLKSYLAAQFTVVSLQKDSRAFTPDLKEVGEMRYKGSVHTDPVDWRHYAFSVQNDAYAQLVSCFCIGPAIHYINTNGSELSITNSTSNFGDVSLYAKGFRDDGNGGGAYYQDRGFKLISIKKPLPLNPTPRRFNLGRVVEIDYDAETITLDGIANTRGFDLVNEDDLTKNSFVYVRGANSVVVSAKVTSVSEETPEFGLPRTVLGVDFTDIENWQAAPNFTGNFVYIQRYADSRKKADKKYYLVLEGDPVYGNRAPTVDYVIRKTCEFAEDTQPFKMTWDVVRERGNLYYIDSVSKVLAPTADTIGMEPREDKEYYLVTTLSAYADERGGSEYRSNLDRSVELDLDFDPSYIDLEEAPENNLTYKALEHILSLLGIDDTDVPLSSYELNEDAYISLDAFAKRIDLNKPSITRCAGQTWEYVGYYNYSTGLPQLQSSTVGEGLSPQVSLFTRFIKLQTQRYGGRIYATGMDELGNLFQGYRVIDFKTGETSTIDPGIELLSDEERDAGDVIFPTYYPELSVDNLTVNETFEFGGETLNLSNNAIVNGENGMTLRIGGVDVITGNSSGEVTSIFDNLAPNTIVSATAPATRDDGSAIEPGDKWFDTVTSGFFLAVRSIYSQLEWVQLNDYVPPERVNGWPGFISPLIPINMIPLQSPAWDSGDTTLEANGCLQISKTDSGYSQGPLFIENGDQLWVRWNPGSPGVCGGQVHGIALEGMIFDEYYFVSGSIVLDRVPSSFNLGGSDNYPLSTLYSSNVATLTDLTAPTKFWVESTNAVGTISYKLNGGSWTTVTAGIGNSVDIPLSIWPTLQFRITSSASNNTLTNLVVRVGESNTAGQYAESTLELWTIPAAVVDPLISTPSIVFPASAQQFQDSVDEIVITSSSYVANAESGAHLNSDWEVWRGSSSASSFASDTTKTQIVNATNQTSPSLTSYELSEVLATSGHRYYARVRHRGSAAGALSPWSGYRIFDILNPTNVVLSTSSSSVTEGQSVSVSWNRTSPSWPALSPLNLRIAVYRNFASNPTTAQLNDYEQIKTVSTSASSGTVSFSSLPVGSYRVVFILGTNSSDMTLNQQAGNIPTFSVNAVPAVWTISGGYGSSSPAVITVTGGNSLIGSSFNYTISNASTGLTVGSTAPRVFTINTFSPYTYTVPISLGCSSGISLSGNSYTITVRTGNIAGSGTILATLNRNLTSSSISASPINGLSASASRSVQFAYNSYTVSDTFTFVIRDNGNSTAYYSASFTVPATCFGSGSSNVNIPPLGAPALGRSVSFGIVGKGAGGFSNSFTSYIVGA